ncbi:hypothetical protein JCM8547_002094 [Rhodosporidiobolus lusitaniae]
MSTVTPTPASAASSEGIKLVPVTPSNASHTIPAVLRLIKDLAAFERAADQVEATQELLRRSFFGEGDEKGHRYAEAVLAYEGGGPGEEGGEAVGMAVYYFTFSTWTGRGGCYLEDLYVSEPHRGRGIAKLLFNYLGKVCDERGCPRLEWVVINWNEPAKAVYAKMGAKHMDEWQLMRLTGDSLKKLAE